MRTILFFIFSFILLESTAQEGLQFDLPKLDSAQIEMERKLLYHQLLTGNLNPELLQVQIQLPDFNFKNELSKRYNYNTGIIESGSLSPILLNYSPSPFFRNGAVFSAASYELSDNFILGGYSFGANSVLSAPFPNQGMNNFDTRGSTLFLQYKVSKNFKIETRVNVTQGAGPGY